MTITIAQVSALQDKFTADMRKATGTRKTISKAKRAHVDKLVADYTKTMHVAALTSLNAVATAAESLVESARGAKKYLQSPSSDNTFPKYPLTFAFFNVLRTHDSMRTIADANATYASAIDALSSIGEITPAVKAKK